MEWIARKYIIQGEFGHEAEPIQRNGKTCIHDWRLKPNLRYMTIKSIYGRPLEFSKESRAS